ncbi:glycosyl hydrolase family 8 [Marisediminicola senii]|uniref:glycosyl hydrolase family 8 n=1 Tax=Marisediminicola senii TaxID=2711233 RepID=UPI0013EDC67B|nr:glycosyl hydrolase family 8 [Marisediminicola senii]
MSRRRAVIAAVIVVAVAVTAVAALFFTGARMPSSPTAEPAGSTSAEPGEPRSDWTATELGQSFLAEWVDDGRVVRRDQGNDTVSEGQAYGMLIALAVDDEESFDEIWSWTQQNMVRPDGLLAWRWSDGEVIDDEPASDADLDVARALVLAGAAFDSPDYVDDGHALAGGILDSMTVQTDAGRILLPGTWAAGTQPYAYNPSYSSPAAFAVLGESTGDARWTELQQGSAVVTTTILNQTDLPPDWAQVNPDGRVDAMAGAAGTGEDVRYSYDAARLPVRYAESCDPADRELAAQLVDPLSRQQLLPAELDLGGTALAEAVHPLAYAARAAAVASAGDTAAAMDDLDAGVAVLDESPTYYGAAWAALAPLMLQSDRLGGCPILEGA